MHIEYTTQKAQKVVRLHDAPEKIKLLAYSTLCQPILEYASEVWDPSSRKLEQQIEAVQRKAVRFIKNLKGISDSVTEILKLSGMKSMSAIRQARRLSFSFYSSILGTLSCSCLHSNHVETIAKYYHQRC